MENDPASRAAVARPIRLIAGWMAAIGPDIVADRALDTEKKQASLQRLHRLLEQLPADFEQRHILQAAHENLAVLIAVSNACRQPIAGIAAPLPLRARMLSPHPPEFQFRLRPDAPRAARRRRRHAGARLDHVFPGPPGHFSHWATITMVLCLQPYFSATWLRTAERVTGTLLGGLVAAGIGLVTQTRLELALAMLPLTMFAFTIRSVSYAAFIAALTPMVVLLVEQIAPGHDELHVALYRIGYTIAGRQPRGLREFPALAGPSRARGWTEHLRRHPRPCGLCQSRILRPAGRHQAPDAARRAAGMASNNLEAALARALLEPHQRRDPMIERGAVADAALRRMAGRLSVLAVDPPLIDASRKAALAGLGGLARAIVLAGKFCPGRRSPRARAPTRSSALPGR